MKTRIGSIFRPTKIVMVLDFNDDVQALMFKYSGLVLGLGFMV